MDRGLSMEEARHLVIGPIGNRGMDRQGLVRRKVVRAQQDHDCKVADLASQVWVVDPPEEVRQITLP